MRRVLLDPSILAFVIIDAVVSTGLAHLFVQVWGWRWPNIIGGRLDASMSILVFSMALGVIVPVVTLIASVVLAVEGPKCLARLKKTLG